MIGRRKDGESEPGRAEGPELPSGSELPSGAVPPGMRIAGAWSWRILAVAGVLALVVFLIVQLRLIVIPLLIAVLIAALLVPFINFLTRHRWPRWLAITVAELSTIAAVAALVWLVVTQVIRGFDDLRTQTVRSYSDLKQYLLDSPLHLSESELNDWLSGIWSAVQQDTSAVVSSALSVGSTVGHVVTGLLLTLFCTLFILIDGRGVWGWLVRLFPRRARPAIDGAGKAGWVTLSSFVRVQILVAFIDAVGIGVGALILQVPLAIPIAVLVFLGSFVPVLGAVVTGALAVFIALVYNGLWPAIIMLIIVLAVQQLEGHVLQPLIIGTAVKVHPLAVILAVGSGAILAGIPGTLFAVPTVAVANVMIGYIAEGRWRSNPNPTIKDVAHP